MPTAIFNSAQSALPPFVWICNPDAFAIRIYNPINTHSTSAEILFAAGLQIRQNGNSAGLQIQHNEAKGKMGTMGIMKRLGLGAMGILGTLK